MASATPAAALTPPRIDPGALVRGAPVAPADPTEQRTLCAKPTQMPGVNHAEPTAAQRMMDLPAAWRISRGAGQRVAVIDTGVTRHPRLARVVNGGDYVSDQNGTTDCDAHGTLVAGLIAAKPSPDDGFAGVAPDSTIIAIRQSSDAYQAKNQRSDRDGPPKVGSGYGTVQTLANAVVHAVDLGATVINISEVACGPADRALGDNRLGAAVRYAFTRNVVVVVAAGNLAQGSSCETQNPSPGPASPELYGWDTAVTIASPAWFAPQVLTVGAVDSATGAPAAFSLHGPWLGVAAPGTDITSLDSTAGSDRLVDAQEGQKGLIGIDGTSFAAPYVSGLAALIRARFPQLTAAQVIDRITRTAHAPGTGRDNAIGHGVIDPVAALTATLPGTIPDPQQAHAIPAPAPKTAPDHRARNRAVIAVAACLGVTAAGIALSIPFRRLRKLRPDEY
ncbi:type VII secretion-associated serine protease mycosin [Williamsia sterculiae]|nr:type VII secretion-associated serine protease mycosin [Williamsia sterculiae]